MEELMFHWLRSMVLVACVFLTASPSRAADAQGRYVFACDRDNDLFRIVSGLIPQVQRFNDPAEAVRRASPGWTCPPWPSGAAGTWGSSIEWRGFSFARASSNGWAGGCSFTGRPSTP